MSKLIACNISQEMAEGLVSLPANTALISIDGPEARDTSLKVSGCDVFKVRFADVNEAFYHRTTTLYTPISAEQALCLMQFIRARKSMNFIVHCYAGVSRSGAVCLFIHLVHGHRLKENFWMLSQPNPRVVGELMIAHASMSGLPANKGQNERGIGSNQYLQG